VIGTGGVGGFFGGKLCGLMPVHPDMHITFIARGRHLQAIRENGLVLNTAEAGEYVCRPDLATDDINEMPAPDLCLLCVKSYDLTGVLNALKAKTTEETLILPLLNGVDIDNRIRKIIAAGIVFPGCVYVGTHIETYGKVTQKGGAGKILFGKDPLHPGTVPDALFGLFAQSRIPFQWYDDPLPPVWEKFIFIAAFGLVTAYSNKTLGEVLDSAFLKQEVRSVMEEIAALAARKDIRLPPDIVDRSMEKGRAFPHGTKTSFQRDFENPGRRDERDLFGDTVIRMGRETGVKTPVTRALADELNRLKPVE